MATPEAEHAVGGDDLPDAVDITSVKGFTTHTICYCNSPCKSV